MTVQELQSRYPDYEIVVTVWDEIHNGEYLFSDNLELGNLKVDSITEFDDGPYKAIRCNC